jgi:hypothetical protein
VVAPTATKKTDVTFEEGGRKDRDPFRTRTISDRKMDGVVPTTTAESEVARFKSPASLSRLFTTSLVYAVDAL